MCSVQLEKPKRPIWLSTSTPLAALKAALPGVRIVHAKGVDNEETPPAANSKLFSPDGDRSVTGLAATYYATSDMSGEPVKRETATSFLKRISGNIAGPQVTGYSEGLLVGYRGYVTRGVEPLFPFGHGLSYTSFVYSALAVPELVKGDEPVTANVTLRNGGARLGKEVVQLYVAAVTPGQGDAPIALRGFSKVDLAPNARRTVTVTLDPRAFSRFDTEKDEWRVVPGRYKIMAGSSSADIRQVREVEVVSD